MEGEAGGLAGFQFLGDGSEVKEAGPGQNVYVCFGFAELKLVVVIDNDWCNFVKRREMNALRDHHNIKHFR